MITEIGDAVEVREGVPSQGQFSSHHTMPQILSQPYTSTTRWPHASKEDNGDHTMMPTTLLC